MPLKERWILMSAVLALAIVSGWALTGQTVALTGAFESPLAHSLAVQPFASPLIAQSSSGNLLINGDMDGGGGQYPFYWRPTNHFVAGMWYEWFWTAAIPEFIDGGHPHHNECYPVPPTGRSCSDMDNHSQGYIRWGDGYVAGIYQPVTVNPCVNYRFEIYHKNQRDPGYISRIGIDPTGQNLPPHAPEELDDYPDNCPPDYQSECPDPGLDSLNDFPPHIVWSPEVHNVWNWQKFSITAEAVSNTLTVWTYTDARNVQTPPKSTYWDYASLVEVPFPDNRLPPPASMDPSGFITNVVTQTVLDFLIIEWDTLAPASTQVVYRFLTETTPVTPTGPYFVYLPLVVKPGGWGEYLATLLDTTPKIHHRAVIPHVREGDRVEFIALSRRPLTTSCQTEISERIEVTIGPIPPIQRVYLPLVSKRW